MGVGVEVRLEVTLGDGARVRVTASLRLCLSTYPMAAATQKISIVVMMRSHAMMLLFLVEVSCGLWLGRKLRRVVDIG